MVKFEIDSEVVLKNWGSLNAVLPKLNEKEVKALLEKEKKGRNRFKLVQRLHQRLRNLETKREREELLKNSNKS